MVHERIFINEFENTRTTKLFNPDKVDTHLNITDQEKMKNRVIIIGAGFNGIGMGCLCKMAGLDFIIIDRAQGVGGTWWYNRFPGAQVDGLSHTYSFSFLSYYGWKNNYSYQYEILNYIRYAVLTFGLEKVHYCIQPLYFT